jgi:ribose-phosphate pyrophosphokinase
MRWFRRIFPPSRVVCDSAGILPTDFQEEPSERFFVSPGDVGRTSRVLVFGGSTHKELTAEVCARLNMQPGRIFLDRFYDGEVAVQVIDEPRGADCYVLHSFPAAGYSGTSDRLNDHVMELLLVVAALKRASARTVTVVVPYFPYSRQIESAPGEYPEALGAADIALMLQTVGVDRVISVDLHRGTIEGMFNVPVMNIDPQALALRYFLKYRPDSLARKPVIVSPTGLSAGRAKNFYAKLQCHGVTDCDIASFFSNAAKEQLDVRRSETEALRLAGRRLRSLPGLIDTEFLVGSVKDRDCIIIDDVIDTGCRLEKTARALKRLGAKKIFAFVTHPVLSRGSIQRIQNSPIVELVTTNSLAPPQGVLCSKLRTLSVGAIVAETIRCVQNRHSVTGLFEPGTVDDLLTPSLGIV